MLVAFPFLAFGLIYAAVFRRERDWRAALLISATCWGTIVTIITEMLSLIGAIGPAPLTIGWLAICLIAGGWLALDWKRVPIVQTTEESLTSFDWRLITIWALVGILVAALGVIAVTAAPNAYDGLVYHMSRVVHWLQNGHVGHYPTGIQRQIYLGPWSGYAILQFQALLDNDYLANAVQWFSLVVSMAGVSLIARRLGAGKLGQTATAALAATIPMSVLQAASPQSDLVVSAWMVCTVWFVLESVRPGQTRNRCFALVTLAGLAFGHAILTKATAYFFGFSFCVWLVVGLTRNRGWKPAALFAALFAAMVLAPNLPNYVRQTRTYGSPLGPLEEAGDPGQQDALYGNASHSPAAIASNVIRNAALELQTPWERPNAGIESVVRALHWCIAIDPNDPRITWPDMKFVTQVESWHSEGFAGNPFHFLVATVAVGFALAWPRAPRWRVTVYAGAILCGFLIFCAMLRWNFWLTRLSLPLLILAMPVLGTLLDKIWCGWLAFSVVIVSIVLAVPVMATNISHPLTGSNAYYRNDRLLQYYYTWEGGYRIYKLHQAILDSATRVKLESVGIGFGHDDVEYAFWMALRARGLRPRIEHINVNNRTKIHAPSPPFEPDIGIVRDFNTGKISIVVNPRPSH